MDVTMTVNGEEVTRDIEPRTLLVHHLRDNLRLTGTHWGCDTSNCGTCVVWVDNEPVKSCTVLAAMAGGHDVRTVEGLEVDGELDPVQEGFMQCHGLQCGFCTPGMMMTARALLDRNPDPTNDEIREAISGQICRCTGYATIVRSIQWAAAKGRDRPHPLSGSRHSPPPEAHHDDHRGPAGTHECGADARTTISTTTSRAASVGCSARRILASCAAGQILRRHRTARHAAPGHPPLADGARPDRQHRQVGGRGAPGVKAVITGADLAAQNLAWMPTLSNDVQAVLATDKVRFQHQEVAFVVAEDRYSARDALELIDVEYEWIDPVIDVRKALAPDAPVIRDDLEGKTNNHCFDWEAGDKDATEAVFADAEVVVSEDIVYPRVHPRPWRRVAAWPTSSVCRASSRCGARPRHRTPIARVYALVAGLPEHKIRIIAPDIGGGFGNKVPIYPGYVLRHRRLAGDRQAGEVDGGPHRESREHRFRPRLHHAR